MRIDKYLADMGFGTRKEVKTFIKNGQVTVGEKTVTDPGFHVSEDDDVKLSGESVRYSEFVYYMMNKPPGVVSATEDPRERTVLDLLDGTVRKGIFPAGRLDKDTVGLLLLTNDGELAHKLLSPAHHVDKRYLVRVKGELKGSDVELFKKGIDIGDDTPTMPAELHIKSSGEISEAEVVIREGRYHQIKRMFSAIGAEVIYLKRLSMGLLLLDPDLPEGAFRPLTDEELYKLSR